MASESFSKVPLSTSSWQRRSYSSAEPSHQWIESGSVSSANSSTQAISFWFLVRCFARRPWSRSRVGSTPLSCPTQRAERPGRGHVAPAGRGAAHSCSQPWCLLAVGRQVGSRRHRCASTSTSRGGSSSGPGSRSPSTASATTRRRGSRGRRGDRRPGGDQVPGADRRADEGRRRQVRRHARRRPRRTPPRSSSWRSTGTCRAACSSTRRPRSPRSTTRASSGTGPAKRPMMLFSDMGGIDIEEVAEQPPRPRRARPPLQPAADLRLPGQAGDRPDRGHRLGAQPRDADPRPPGPADARLRHDAGRDQPPGPPRGRQLRRPRRPHGDGGRGQAAPEGAARTSSGSATTRPASPTSRASSSAT